MSWVFWLVSIGGIGGAIAFVVLAPAIAVPLLTSAFNGLMNCRPCLVALAIAAAAIAGHVHGRAKEAAACRAADLAAELRNARIDQSNAEAAARNAAARVSEIEEASTKREAADADYIHSLKVRPACLLDDADIGRLRPRSGRARGARSSAGAR